MILILTIHCNKKSDKAVAEPQSQEAAAVPLDEDNVSFAKQTAAVESELIYFCYLG